MVSVAPLLPIKQTEPLDLVTFASVPGILAVVALLACCLPARQEVTPPNSHISKGIAMPCCRLSVVVCRPW
jgi:hypothetical protein